MDLGDFRALVMGEGVRLTEVEADIVFRRIEVARLKSAGTKGRRVHVTVSLEVS